MCITLIQVQFMLIAHCVRNIAAVFLCKYEQTNRFGYEYRARIFGYKVRTVCLFSVKIQIEKCELARLSTV